MSESDERRRRIVADAVAKSKFAPRPPTEEQQLVQRAMYNYQQTIAMVKPVLMALPGPLAYNEHATQLLVMKSLKDSFATWSKDELHFLVCMMHTEEAMKSINAQVSAGLVGPDMDKPI